METLIFAAITVFLLWRYKDMLGSKPDGAPPFSVGDETPDAPKRVQPAQPLDGDDCPRSLASTLKAMEIIDPSFDEKDFLKGAKSAFTMIIEDYSNGRLNEIDYLFNKDVLALFTNGADQVQPKEVLRINEANLTAAELNGTTARISVFFVSEQALADAPEEIEEVQDRWTFERNLASKNPNWLVVSVA